MSIINKFTLVREKNMKKGLIKFITLLCSAVILLSAAAGCNLVTKNNQKDMEQVVATVNINNEENIYKRDLVMAYLNYGYIYTQYYGYTQERTLNLILDSLVESNILYQEAMNIFENDDNYVKDAGAEKFSPERYLSEDDKVDAEYNACLSISRLLDSYSEENKDAENKDDLGVTVRTVPTDAANATKELSVEEKNEFIAKGFDTDSNEYRKKAFAAVVNMLNRNGLLGDKYKGDLKDSDYYRQLYKNNLEDKVVHNYEDYVLASALSSLTYDKLQAAYTAQREEQVNWSNEEFVSALSSATAGKPILYSNQGTYGYIYNLLIGVNDYQSEKISAIKSDNPNLTDAEYAEKRAEILNSTVAKDLRSTWILSGYDFDGEKFTGDYTFAKNPENSLGFKGEVKLLKEATDDDAAVYGVVDVNLYSLNEFIELVNQYVYGDGSVGETGGDASVYRKYDCDLRPEEYEAKINELLFAFSTDPGSLNTYKGYVIKPVADGSSSEDYVKTFGDAGRKLLDMGKASYIVVASDYGYHFIFFSEVFEADYGFETLDEYLDSLDIDKNGAATWEEYFNDMLENWEDFEDKNNYLYLLADELVSRKVDNAISESRTSIVNKYRYEEKGSVVVYEGRFSDLYGN